MGHYLFVCDDGRFTVNALQALRWEFQGSREIRVFDRDDLGVSSTPGAVNNPCRPTDLNLSNFTGLKGVGSNAGKGREPKGTN